ncbi:MAG: two-component regulator propeller domain-containing protein [Bacteroidota bacterium]
MKILFFLINYFLLVTNLQAQVIHFKNFSRSEGLPQNFVYTIQTGPEGYLWFGTGEGLSRFDGTSFQNFALQSNHEFVTSSLLSSKNTLWFGFFDGGIGYYNQLADSITLLTIKGAQSKVNKIIEIDDGTVLFLNQNGSIISSLDGDIRLKEAIEPTLIFYDGVSFGKDQLLVASNKGLLKVRLTENAYSYQVVNQEVFFVIEKYNDLFWVGWHSGIATIDARNWKIRAVFETRTPVNAILTDRHARLWVGTNGDGVLRFSNAQTLTQQKNFTAKQGLSSGYVQSLGLDREGNVWVGSAGSGISMFTGDEFTLYQKGILKTGVNALERLGEKDFWVGTPSGLIALVNGIAEKVLLAEKSISSLKKDRKKNLWIGTEGDGIWLLPKGENKPIRVTEIEKSELKFINDIELDSKGTLWFASRLQGVLAYSETAGTTIYSTSNALLHNNIHDIYCDTADKIWLASSDPGLGYISNRQFFKLDEVFAFNRFEINCLLGEADGGLWLGTHGGGLFYLREDSLVQFSKTDVLLSDFIYTLGKDKMGDIWVGSRNGLNVIKKSNGNFVQFSNEKRTYATLNFAKNAFFADKNNVTIGVEKGLITYTHRPNTAPVAPLVKLEKIEINGNEQSKTAKLVLPYGSYRLGFHFKAVHFSNPDQIKFRYYLSGYEANWTDFTEFNSAYYPKLEDGQYQLFIEAIDAEGISNISPTTFSLIIQKPFWKTWWFYLVSILFFIIAAFSIHQIRLRRLIKANEKLADANGTPIPVLRAFIVAVCASSGGSRRASRVPMSASNMIYRSSGSRGTPLLSSDRIHVRVASEIFSAPYK